VALAAAGADCSAACAGRPYLINALRDGHGSSFGIARLLKTPSHFVTSRIYGDDGPLGSVTINFDAPMRIQHLIIGALVLGLGLALILPFGRIASQFAERRLRAEQDRAIEIYKAAQRDLTVKVRERTAELAECNASLKEEVQRRQGLELKLRQALDSVNAALAQQGDFVALVSHEFRAPLAVIAAAADNIASAPPRGRRKHHPAHGPDQTDGQRMSMLIENVLAGDRIGADGAPRPAVETFDLNDMLNAVAAGLDDDAGRRVNFVHTGKASVNGDR
jgi:C4-dicarboxylate-specific signal transduction histidine kinase